MTELHDGEPDDSATDYPASIENSLPPSRRLEKVLLRSERLLGRMARREIYIMITVLVLVFAVVYQVAAASHARTASGNAEQTTKDTQQQVKALESQNHQLALQVSNLLAAIKVNRQETLKNRDAGTTTRVIACETLKAVDVEVWTNDATCQAVR